MTDPKDSDNIRTWNAARLEQWRDFMDLPVPIGIELGRTRLSIASILALDQNSVLQLQRSTAEGVDVVAGEVYLARGQIIMIEDRTGVRLHEVIPPKEGQEIQHQGNITFSLTESDSIN